MAHKYPNIPSNLYWAKIWWILLEQKVRVHGLGSTSKLPVWRINVDISVSTSFYFHGIYVSLQELLHYWRVELSSHLSIASKKKFQEELVTQGLGYIRTVLLPPSRTFATFIIIFHVKWREENSGSKKVLPGLGSSDEKCSFEQQVEMLHKM